MASPSKKPLGKPSREELAMKLHAPAVLDDGVYYPTEDGEPMGETGYHVHLLLQTYATLHEWARERPRVYVGANNLMYYERGNPRRVVCPDIFVVFGIAKEPPRNTYKLWVERKSPSVIIELTSASTVERDQVEKLRIYRDILRVREYFLFDPLCDYLDPPQQGFRLVSGAYVPIKPVAGRLPSKSLKLHLERNGWQLRFYDPATGSHLFDPLAAGSARREAETAMGRETAARREAEAALEREAAARQQAEAEAERLRRELEALKRQHPGRA